MLKKLFRPMTQAKWQHNDANIRLKAIEKMDEQQSSILEQLALKDSDAQVRDTALNKITDKSRLLILAQDSKNTQRVLQRWTTVLSDNQHTQAYDAEQIISACTDANLLAAIISYCANTNFAELALAGLNNEEQLLQLLQNSKSTRLWQQVIEKLHTSSSLKQAQSIVKGRDKGALQKIKQKIEQLDKQHQAAQDLHNKQQHLLERATQLNLSQAPLHLQGEILNLQQQSEALLEADKLAVISAEAQQQFTQQLQQLNEKLTLQQQSQADEKNKTQQIQVNAELSEKINRLHTSIQQNPLDTSIVQECQNDFLNLEIDNHKQDQSIKTTSHKVQQLLSLCNELNESKLFTLNSKNIDNLNNKNLDEKLQLCSKFLLRCKQSNLDKAVIDQLLSVQTALQKQQKLQLNNTQKIEQQLQQLLIETESLLADNDEATAKNNLKTIKNYSEQLNKQLLQKHQASISRIHKQLHALDDWKTYSTEPKREALIQAMNDLSTLSLTAEIRLDKIKTLQKEWKSLGYCQNQSLWKNFQKASDIAYLPCKENFDEQKNLRAFNAQQRTTICEQLEQFIQGQDFKNSALDWKNIEKLNREIINEWKKFSPLEPKQHKALQKRFSTSFDFINNEIHQQQINTEEQLKGLCDNAKNLNEQEDKHEAIKSFQQLMQQWKTLCSHNISRHKQQQILWTEFKLAGDVLYEGRQTQFKTAEKEILDNATQAQALIETIKQLAISIKDKTQDTIKEDLKALQEAKQAFQSIGSLPKNQFKTLKQDFEKFCEASNEAIQQASKNSWLHQLQNLVDFGQQCTKAEQDNIATAELIPSTFPTGWNDALQSRFGTRCSDQEYDVQARSLCIAIEKLYGLTTPESDNALKMELQMQQLAENFGQQKSLSHNDELETLYLKWFSLPCWNKPQHQQLEQRFLAATQA